MSERRLGAAEYLASLQCERRAWRALCRADAGGPDPLDAWLEERSALPGALAALAPGAAVVDAQLAPEAARAHTLELLGAAGVERIAGAVLERGGWVGRADLLRRERGGEFALALLVSDTTMREVDLDRAAFAAWLVQGCAALGAVELWHLDAAYCSAAAQLDWPALVRRRDVTRDVRLLLSDVPAQLARAAALCGREAQPAAEPSPHCWRPQRCEHWDACTGELPHGALALLPRLRAEQLHAWRERGIERIAQLPDDEPLEPSQRHTRAAWRCGGAVAAPELGARLRALGPALAHLDFEAAVPALPLVAHSRPFEPLPALWSLLRPDGVGGLSGADFLAPSGCDPRAQFAASLCAELADWKGPIAVYSDFEARALERLAELEPAHAAELARIRSQLVDLLPLVREGVAHPAFRGSYSLKRVAAVLCPGISYGDLRDVANGAQAAHALHAWVSGTVGSAEARLAAALRVYCRRDVEALAALHGALGALAAQPGV